MSLDPLDYGDPAVWRDAGFADASDPEAPGWEWVGADDTFGLDEQFSRAAIDALAAGEELLARDLGRLTRSDIEPE